MTPTSQATSYTERLNSYKKSKNLQFPGGFYKLLYKGFQWGKGRNPPHNRMITTEWAVLEAPPGNDEVIEKLRQKGRKVKKNFVFSQNGYGFDEFLEFLEKLGADLSICRPELEDPEYADLRAFLSKAELTPPKIEAELTWKPDNPRFPEIKFKEVQKIFSVAAAGAPVSPPTAPATSPAPPAVIYYLVNGVPTAESREQIQNLILTAGYSGKVCIDGVNWIESTEAGFTVPPPLNTPAAPVDVVKPPAEAMVPASEVTVPTPPESEPAPVAASVDLDAAAQPDAPLGVQDPFS